MSVLDCLSDDVAEAWAIYFGDAIERLDARGIVVEGPGDLDALIHVLDTVIARGASGRDAIADIPEGMTDISDVCEAMDELYDEEELMDEAEEYFDRRFPIEQEACEQIAQLIWTKADPSAAPWNNTSGISETILRSAKLIDDEPFELYMARAKWAIADLCPGVAEKMEAHVANAAVHCFGCKKGDLPQGIQGWVGAVSVETLSHEAADIWEALGDLGKATMKADGWMRRLSEDLRPNPDGDRTVIPHLADILADPANTPIVVDKPQMRTMLSLLLEGFDDDTDRLASITRYSRRFPMDFRAVFILHLLNSGDMDPQLGGYEEFRRADEAAYNYLKRMSVPAPRGPGRMGPVEG